VTARLSVRLLPDGKRLYLQDGPINLIAQAWGAPGAVRASYRAAARRTATILDELCEELPLLRADARRGSVLAQGRVARQMQRAVAPHADRLFISPMAAVAGAVAEEVLHAMQAAAALDRAFVNNGGDIAIHLAPGQRIAAGLVDRPDRPSLFARAVIGAADPVRGLATSGWRGRSFSLGIADAVTVLAGTAAAADAAATVIANAVDLPGHPAVRRVPARDLDPDSDLGYRAVTRAVGSLGEGEIAAALDGGEAAARPLLAAGLIHVAALHLAGATRVVGATQPQLAGREMEDA
jgi:ApbE superfamily uncharacterized protein (UPF0280 family)